jgi:hypothetical protein
MEPIVGAVQLKYVPVGRATVTSRTSVIYEMEVVASEITTAELTSSYVDERIQVTLTIREYRSGDEVQSYSGAQAPVIRALMDAHGTIQDAAVRVQGAAPTSSDYDFLRELVAGWLPRLPESGFRQGDVYYDYDAALPSAYTSNGLRSSGQLRMVGRTMMLGRPALVASGPVTLSLRVDDVTMTASGRAYIVVDERTGFHLASRADLEATVELEGDRLTVGVVVESTFRS